MGGSTRPLFYTGRVIFSGRLWFAGEVRCYPPKKEEKNGVTREEGVCYNIFMSRVTIRWMKSFGIPEKEFQKACERVSQVLLFQDVKNVSLAFRQVAEIYRRQGFKS